MRILLWNGLVLCLGLAIFCAIRILLHKADFLVIGGFITNFLASIGFAILLNEKSF